MAKAVTKIVRASAMCATLIVLLFSGCSVATTRSAARDLTLNITSPENNTELFTNLANVTGTVSIPNASVTVQGHPAFVDAAGNFTGYALLSEGANTFEVAASANGQTRTQTVPLSFTPPLAVFLDYPRFPAHYALEPIVVTGYVSNPAATVSVQGFAASVAPDGSFTATVQLTSSDNTVTARATLGGQTDSDVQYISKGGLGPPPPIPYISPMPDFDRLVYVDAGSVFTQDVIFAPGHSIRHPSPLSYPINPVGVSNGNIITVSWPAGMELSLFPSEFTIYPNAIYRSLMIIKTSPDLASGLYRFEVYPDYGSGGTGGGIDIVVLPRNGSIEKTIQINQERSVGGILIMLLRVELSATGMKIYALNKPPVYSLPQGPDLAPPQYMDLYATASYSIDNGPPIFAGTSGISFLDIGMLHEWDIDVPIAKGSRELEFTINSLGDWDGPWKFVVPLG